MITRIPPAIARARGFSPRGMMIWSVGLLVLASCSGRGGTGPFTAAETSSASFRVERTHPADGARDVRASQTIDVEFNDSVDRRSVTTDTFVVLRAGEPLRGKVAAAGRRARFVPREGLPAAAELEVVLTREIRNSRGGALAGEHRFAFATEGHGPLLVEALAPKDGQQEVPREVEVRVRFDRALDPASVGADDLKLFDPVGRVASEVSVKGAVLELRPLQPLGYEQRYEVSLAAGLRASDGGALEEAVQWSFETVPRRLEEPVVFPSPDSVDVDPGVTLRAEFAQDLDPSSVHEASFILRDGQGVLLEAVVEYENRIATLSPAGGLLPRSTYTATLTTDIRGAEHGETLRDDLSWSFTTRDYESFRVNFQSPEAPVPDGYLQDFGEPYGPRQGADQGVRLTYGWVETGTDVPTDRTLDGRDREANLDDQRLDTFMHMQVGSPASWEIELPNGFYQVTVCAGDSSDSVDSAHRLTVEGLVAISGFVPAPPVQHHATATVTSWVRDGRLTIEPTGGLNTKINYADIVPVDTSLAVNFQSEGAPVPLGHLRDFGEPLALRTGVNQGAGLTFGWVLSGTGTPYDRTGDGRDRDKNPDDQRLDTLMHMQKASDASFEVALPEGLYEVTVVVGDSDVHTDSVHRLVVEGVVAIDGFIPNPPEQHHETGMVEVEIQDGFLTVDPTGGANAKLNYLEVRAVTTSSR